MNFALFLTLLFITNSFAKDVICSQVVVHGTFDLELTDTEKRLVCGDRKLDAYKSIPPYQASYFLTGFLQARGYLKPTFTTENDVLHAHVGKIAKLEKISVSVPNMRKEEKFIKRELKRRYIKKIVTPDLLNVIEGETKSHLRQRGYPCVAVKSTLDADTNKIDLSATKAHYQHFGPLKRQVFPELNDDALDRYYPFTSRQKFNERQLTLTEKRMLRSEVVQGTYFLEECSAEGDKFSLSQRFIIGPPRTLRFGIGASTEVGPMARVRWSHNRLGSMASILSARLQGSFRSQSLALSADTFFWKDAPRRSLLSQFEILRESQIDYEQTLIKLSPVTTKWTRDLGGHQWIWTLGPSFEAGTYHSKIKTDTRSYKTGVIDGSINIMSHTYEFFDVHPTDGDNLTFTYGFRHPQLGFTDPSLRLDASYVKLSRLAEMGRGILIGGYRINTATLIINDDVTAASLPPNVKFFGGGSDDIRGFPLNTLPRNDGGGALTKLSLKLELRKTYFFRETVEGFTFLDGAYFGQESFHTSKELFYSPGVGIRWLSPIGMIQTFAARALTSNDDFGNLFYVGLGGTF